MNVFEKGNAEIKARCEWFYGNTAQFAHDGLARVTLAMARHPRWQNAMEPLIESGVQNVRQDANQGAAVIHSEVP